MADHDDQVEHRYRALEMAHRISPTGDMATLIDRAKALMAFVHAPKHEVRAAEPDKPAVDERPKSADPAVKR